MYICDIWPPNLKEQRNLQVFESKILCHQPLGVRKGEEVGGQFNSKYERKLRVLQYWSRNIPVAV